MVMKTMINLKAFEIITILSLLINFQVYSQQNSNDRLLEMKNCFILGLSEKGLEIASELLSKAEYTDVREEAVYYIAEFFFVIGLRAEEDNVYDLSRAYTYYVVYSNDYPNSKYSEAVHKKIKTLESYFGEFIKFQNLLDFTESEALVVDKKLLFATKTLFWYGNPDIFKFFSDTESEQSSIELLDRYFDEIIINHPDFEMYAYYYKILARFSKIAGRGFAKEGLLKFNVDRFTLHSGSSSYTSKGKEFKVELEEMLKPLSEKYPSHPLVLNLHLIYADFFMLKIDDKFDSDTKQHLEFVVKNEPDKTHPRYLLAKEFLLSNKFQ